ncbi:MAG: hypothetical protein EOP90_01695 [Lysobacteraceae bacterium]|nr:MAG: hypothetical protein EOP90_01695 [Xanthomonadaceae bacterium]
MNRMLVFVFLAATLTACQSTPAPRRATVGATAAAPLAGVYDNHAQVWSARGEGEGLAAPHVRVGIEATRDREWSIWTLQLDAGMPLEAAWAMRRSEQAGTLVLVPHRALVTAPARGKAFDPAQWAALDACSLRGPLDPLAMRVQAEPAACTALAPGIGAQAALLPLALEHEDEWLRVRLYADQARGPDAREELRRVRVYGGWAAINGGGPRASADSSDWHMDRALQLASEGGRAALAWRDGQPSGYSLLLERLAYRDGEVPVLKLSIIDDATSQALAYAWADPDAARIGINLGWVQVGLERDAVSAAPAP